MYQSLNKELIIGYFKSGEKEPGQSYSVGVELEHFIVEKDTLAPISYEPKIGRLGVRDILAYLESFYPKTSQNPQGDLIGLEGDDGSITIEPSAQLEISLAPFKDIEEVQAAYVRFRKRLDSFLEAHNLVVINAGYHPSAEALDLELIPKDRYRLMDSHFNQIGTHGERMMRASASLQVSVDYQTENDAVRKIRVASALAPILAAISDNTRVFEGRQIPYSLARMRLWRDVDNTRCTVVPGVFDSDFGYDKYADWILRTSPIFIDRPSTDDPHGSQLREAKGRSAAEMYNDAPMSKHDIEHLISMFWPDVRLKRFVEIRPADCLPTLLACGYVALIKGLFYSDNALNAIEEYFGVENNIWNIRENDVESAIEAIATDNLDAFVYTMSLRDWENKLFHLASQNLSGKDASYLEALQAFALEKYSQEG